MTEITTHAPGTFSWVDVNVETDEQRERLMNFFATLHGWTWDVNGPEMGNYSIAHLNGQPVMGIGQGPGGRGQMVPYLSTTDVAASAARASELGATVFMGPMEVPETGVMALVADPTGAVHGLWQPINFTGFGRVHEPGSIGWYNHTSTDDAAAASYYQALTGHNLITPEPGMSVLANGEEWFASFSPDTEGQPSQWIPIYISESLARTRETATSLGATVVVEEMPVPGSAITVFVEPVMQTAVTVMQAGQAPA